MKQLSFSSHSEKRVSVMNLVTMAGGYLTLRPRVGPLKMLSWLLDPALFYTYSFEKRKKLFQKAKKL